MRFSHWFSSAEAMLRIATLTTFLLLFIASSPAAEWQLAPHFASGQEFVYRGTVKEESLGRAVQFTKLYKLELRALVLEQKGQTSEVAFLTSIQPQQQANAPEPPPATVRLEVTEADVQGRLLMRNRPPHVLPIDGPNTWEFSFLHELPKGAITPKQTWTATDAGQPPKKYRVVGTEAIGSTTCLRIEMEQQSEHWQTGRGDQSSWLRMETIWLNTRLGIAERVLRKLHRRDPAHLQTTYVQSVEYELESTPRRYEGGLFEDRKREIQMTRQFHEQVMALLAEPRRPPAKTFEALVTKIDQAMQKHQATPYRDALQRVRALTLAASKGHVPPQLEDLIPRTGLAIGRPAPEFLVDDLLTRQNVTLRGYRGQNVLLIFVQPSSDIASEVLRHALTWREQFGEKDVALVCLSMSDDAEAVRKLAERRDWKGPMLSGRALRVSYGVDATPRMVLVDREGVVRAAQSGWGPEIPTAMESEIRKLARQGKPQMKPGTP
jgi:peroxiredoxin